VTPAKINILMTGGGAPGAAGILQCLLQDNRINVTVADADPAILGRYPQDAFELIPIATDKGFSSAMQSICRQKSIDCVLPLVTKELLPFSKDIEDFRKLGTKVLVSPVHSLEIANNKSRLYEFLEWRGLAVPAFRIVETVEQFSNAVKELGYPSRDLCFKPSISNGSRGFRILTSSINELDLLFNHKPTSTYMSLADAVRILSSGSFPELLVGEFLPGPEYSVDCLADHGETVIAIPRLRKKMINGISVEGEFVQDNAIIEYSRAIIKELQLHGNIGIQVKQATGGQYLVLEINPRVQGTISAGLGAGINLPLLAIKQELGLPISESELEVKWGTRFFRYWSEGFY
jgi:carbamoyl-phosphate synthase large subunit